MRYILTPVWLQSIALGHVYVLFYSSLGFAHKLHYRRSVLIGTWKRRFHWASWLGLSLVFLAPLLATGITGHWWALGILCVALVVCVVISLLPLAGYTTTIGHGILKHPNHGEPVLQHEFVHVDDYEDNAMRATALSGIGLALGWFGWIGAAALWATGGMAWLTLNYVTGFLRFFPKTTGKFWRRVMLAGYEGSAHERWAYDETGVGRWELR